MTISPAPQNPVELEPWYTKAQIARYLRRSTRWVELMHHQGLPSIQLSPGGPRLYRISHVEAWRERRMRDA